MTMDPHHRAQDVLRCTLCETSVPPLFCETCTINLCEACVGEHLLDESKEHIVMPIKQRGFTSSYPTCLHHSMKICELHCEHCDIPVCVLCISSQKHQFHDVTDIKNTLERKKIFLKIDLEELEKYIYPKYQEIASSISEQKANLGENYRQLSASLNKRGREWHRRIDNIIKGLQSDINDIEAKHLTVLNKHEDEIATSISVITQSIVDLKKLLHSNDIYYVNTYKSRTVDFKRLPPKLVVSIPKFSFQRIDREKLFKQFGSLTAFSIKSEGRKPIGVESSRTTSSSINRPLLLTPQTLATIETGYDHLHDVTCLSDEQIWTLGNNNVMKLFNLNGKLLETFHTNLGNRQSNISITRRGELAFTDKCECTVNIVMNKQIQEIVKLQGWMPQNVCCSYFGDFLVVMQSDDRKHTKVVRYAGSTEIQSIQFDHRGKPLYSSSVLCNFKYISENRNRDICVADHFAGAVVVVNHDGKRRFLYTGPPLSGSVPFKPVGITTDSQSRILTSDFHNYRIHIVDQNGQFLQYIGDCD